MNIRNFFRKRTTSRPAREGQGEGLLPLRIEGIGQAPLTPEPDDAELAAQALLEMLAQSSKFKVQSSKRKVQSSNAQQNLEPETLNLEPSHDARYYRHLADRIRQTREVQRQRCVRFLAFVEQELRKRHLPVYGDGSLGLLEAELYKRMDIVDREGGPLKRRWQHCLAEVTVRLMKAAHDGDGNPTNSGPVNPTNSGLANPTNSGVADPDNNQPK